MTAEQATGFLLFAIVAAITPGPSNLIVTSTGATVGIVRGLPALAGVAVGMGFMMFLVAFGLGSLVLGQPLILLLLKVGGVGFLLWLAWKIATAGRSDITTDKEPVGFWGAAAFQWVNPKSWLVSVSAAGTYLHAQAGSALTQSLFFGLLFVLAALPSCFVWLAFGASLQRFLQTERTARVFNIAMGTLLVGAVALFIR
jgi:threonine/homoserine/homoserine lactone efflux protein